MGIAVIAGYLAGLGFWQILASTFSLAGMSILGNRRSANAVLGGLLLGVAALIGGGELLSLSSAVWLPVGIVAGFGTSVALGALANRDRDPIHLLLAPGLSADWAVEQVKLAVSLPDRLQPNDVITPASLVRDHPDAVPRPGGTQTVPTQPGTLFMPARAHAAAVILLCGAGDNRLAFKWPLIRELNRRGVAVLSLDPPGHGDFQAVPTTLGNTQAAAQAGFAWLAARYPAAKLGAIGISFGGNQAAWLAAHEARVAALVLISTPASLSPVTRKIIAFEALSMLLPANLGAFRWGSMLDFWRGWRSMRGYVAGPETLYGMINRYHTGQNLAALGGRPVLIAHGDADAAVPVSNARLLAGMAQHELLIVPQGTHLTLILRPEVASHIAEWVGARLA